MRSKILRALEKNSRLDIGLLAAKLGKDEATILNEMEDMEKEGVICGYHTMINWDKVSEDSVTALIELCVTPQKERGFDRMAKKIYEYPEVESVYLISGSYDFLVTITGRSLREAAHFVNERLAVMDGVQSTATHFILKKYKDHGTIMEMKEKSERIPMSL